MTNLQRYAARRLRAGLGGGSTLDRRARPLPAAAGTGASCARSPDHAHDQTALGLGGADEGGSRARVRGAQSWRRAGSTVSSCYARFAGLVRSWGAGPGPASGSSPPTGMFLGVPTLGSSALCAMRRFVDREEVEDLLPRAVVAARGSRGQPDPGGAGKGGSSPDKTGAGRNYQTARAR